MILGTGGPTGAGAAFGGGGLDGGVAAGGDVALSRCNVGCSWAGLLSACVFAGAAWGTDLLDFSLNRIEFRPQMITQSFSRMTPFGSWSSRAIVVRTPFLTIVISASAAPEPL